MNKTVIVKQGQTMFDIAIQEYGSVEAIGMLMEDNPQIVELTAIDLGGTKVLVRQPIPPLNIMNRQIAAGFAEAVLPPASLYSNIEIE